MYKSIRVVDKEAALNRVLVSVSLNISAEFSSFNNSVSRPSALGSNDAHLTGLLIMHRFTLGNRFETYLKTLNNAVAKGALSAWHSSASVFTGDRPSSRSNCCNGLYSSAGITKSCKYLETGFV